MTGEGLDGNTGLESGAKRLEMGAGAVRGRTGKGAPLPDDAAETGGVQGTAGVRGAAETGNPWAAGAGATAADGAAPTGAMWEDIAAGRPKGWGCICEIGTAGAGVPPLP